jgi:hypothetical protein
MATLGIGPGPNRRDLMYIQAQLALASASCVALVFAVLHSGGGGRGIWAAVAAWQLASPASDLCDRGGAWAHLRMRRGRAV